MRSYIGLRILMGDVCRSIEEALEAVTASVGCDDDEVDLYELEELVVSESDFLSLDNEMCCIILTDHDACTVEELARNLANRQERQSEQNSFIISHLSPSVEDLPSITSHMEQAAQVEDTRNAMMLLNLCERYNSKAEAMKTMADLVTTQLVNMQLHIESSVVSVKSMFRSADVAKCFSKLDMEAPFAAEKRAETQQRLARLVDTEIQEYGSLLARLEQHRQRLLTG